MKKQLIAIVGGIAVGKTTVGKMIVSNCSSIRFIEEDVSKNEFLKDFYDDMQRWAFHSRISTLAMIASNYVVSDAKEDVILMDRCLDELIAFARLQYEKGNLSNREYKVYCQLYNDILAFAPKIDKYIYCYCEPEISLERIRKRNRDFEQGIDVNYLNRLNKQYDSWIKSLNQKSVFYVNSNEDIDLDGLMEFIEKE